jgi:hypothetical protein
MGTKMGMKGASRTTLVESMNQKQMAPVEAMRAYKWSILVEEREREHIYF